jgi:hypothetical protein
MSNARVKVDFGIMGRKWVDVEFDHHKGVEASIDGPEIEEEFEIYSVRLAIIGGYADITPLIEDFSEVERQIKMSVDGG